MISFFGNPSSIIVSEEEKGERERRNQKMRRVLFLISSCTPAEETDTIPIYSAHSVSVLAHSLAFVLPTLTAFGAFSNENK